MSRLPVGLLRSARGGLITMLAVTALLAVGVLLAPLTGHRIVVLQSGSMAPSIPAGSMAIIESVEPSDVRVGDVVTVVLERGGLLTHRVVGETTLDGYPALTVRGDANARSATEVVSLDRLAGRVVAHVPGLGYAIWWLSQPGGSVASIALIGLMLVAIGALGRWSGRPARRSWTASVNPTGAPSRAPLARLATVVDRGSSLGFDKPVVALLLNLILVIAAGATLPSAAIFTTSTGIGGNTFSSATWGPSNYRSLASGIWGDAGTWQRYNGITWVAATRPPSSIDGVVTVRNAHVVTIASDLSMDEVVVAAGGQVVVPVSVQLTAVDAPGIDIAVFGTVDAAGSLTVGAGAEVSLESGGLLLDSGVVDGSGTLVGQSGTLQASGGPRTIALPVTLTTSLTVSGGENLRLDGPLSDVGSLTKNGTGNLTLGAASTYTGVTTINGGTLHLGVDDAIPTVSATTVASGAVLDLAGHDQTVGSLAGAGSVTSSTNGAVLLTVGGNGVGTGTFSGVVADGSGQVALTKIGSGTLTLSGVNTFSGHTTISAGGVSISSDSGLGTAPGSPASGQLTIGTGTLTTTATMALDSNRGIALTGTGTFSVASGTLTFGGTIAGGGSLTKLGAGTLLLAGANSYGGATSVEAGTLSISDDSALGSPPAFPTPDHLTIGTATLTTTATFDIDARRGMALSASATVSVATATTLTYDGIIGGAGTLSKTSNGTLVLGGINTYTGATTLTAGTVSITADAALGTPPGTPTPAHLSIGAATLATTADMSIDPNRGISNTGGTGTISVAAGTTLSYGGILAGTGTLAKTSTGVLALSGANTYSGATTISAGVIRVQSDDALGSIAGGATIVSGAAIEIDGAGLDIAQPITSLSGTGVGGTGALRNLANANAWTGTITFAATSTISSDAGLLTTGALSILTRAVTIAADGDVLVGAAVTGTTGTLTKNGTGNLTLGAASTYTGVTTINGGTLHLGVDDAIATASATTVASGAVLDLAGHDQTVGSLAGAGSVTSSTNGAVLLTVGGNGVGTGTFSGVVDDGSGQVALTKIGSGTLTLSGVNTFSGRATISAGGVSISSDSGLGTAPGSPASGQLTIGTGTLTTTATMALDSNRGIALTGTGTFSVASGTTLSVDGVVAGGGALVKTSTGTLALGGVNTYTGTTTLSSGVVSIAAASALGVAPGSPTPGHLTIGTATLATTGDVTFSSNGGVALTGTGTFSIGAGTTLTYPGIATGTGALTKTGTGTLALGGANSYTGLTTISAGVIRVQHATALGTTAGATTVASAAAIEIDGAGLTVAEPVTSLIGTGFVAGGALRNLANNNTWSGTLTIGTGNASVNTDGGLLTLGAVGGATRTLTVGGAGDTSIGGVIGTTSGTLVKNGGGTLTLGAVNTYTGVTTVNAGTVALGVANAIGPSSATTVAAGGVLDLNGHNETVGSLAGAGTVTSSAPGPVTLTVGGNGVGTGTFSGAIENGGGVVAVTKIGTGTLTLSGTVSTYTGTVTINAGTISATNDRAFGAAPAAPTSGAIAVNGATLATSATFALDQDRGIAITGSATWSVTNTLTYSGVIAGSGSLAKTGAGTLTLGAAANTYAGATTITAGVVSIAADSALGAVPGSPTPGRLSIGTATLTTTASFTLNSARGVALTGTGTFSVASGTVLSYDGIIDGSGALTKTTAGTLSLGGSNTYTGATTVTGGVIRVRHVSALGTTAGVTSIASAQAVEIDGAGLVIAEPLSMTGTGISSGGALRNLANTNSWTGAITLTGASTIVSDGGTLSLAGITATNLALTVGGVGHTTISGTIATGSGALVKSGTGTLTLGGANSYTGATTISAGVVRVQHATALGTTAGTTTVASGAAIEIDGSGLSIAEPVTSIIGTGVSAGGALRNLANNNTWSGTLTIGAGNATVNADGGVLTLGAVSGAARTLTVGGAGDTSIGGVIGTTTGTVVKNGGGTLTLGSVNTYTGTTTVNAGRVQVDGSTSSGAVTVAAGSFLGGSGTIGGAVTVTGTIQPGAPPGRLTSLSLTMSSSSTYRIDIGGTTVVTQYSQGRVSGTTFTINASVTLSLVKIGSFTPTTGQTFTILDKVGAGAISGTFAGLAEAATISNFLGSGLNAQITYVGGDGNDIVITVL